MKKLLNKLKINLINNLEILIILCLAGSIAYFTTINFIENIFNSYFLNQINGVFIGLFGGLLGLLITAYAIIFSIAPTLNKEVLESGHFLRINKLFLIIIFSLIISLIISISFIFISKMFILSYLFRAYLFFFIFELFSIMLIVLVIFILFKINRENILRTE